MKIDQLEDAIRQRITELNQMDVMLNEIQLSRETLQVTYEETLQQKRVCEALESYVLHILLHGQQLHVKMFSNPLAPNTTALMWYLKVKLLT